MIPPMGSPAPRKRIKWMTGIRRRIFLPVVFLCCATSGCRPEDGGPTGEVLRLAAPHELASVAGPLSEEFNRLLPQETRLEVHTVPGADIRTEHEDAAAVMDWREPPDGRFSARVGWIGLLIVVHPDNPLGGISADDVRAVFSGRIDRWEDVGGPAGAITAVTYGAYTGWGELFAAVVLGPNRLAGDAVIAPSPGELRAAMREDPQAIGWTTGCEGGEGLKILPVDGTAATYPNLLSGVYPFRIPIFIDADDPPAEEIEQFAGWLQSVPGQTALMQLQSEE
jgi:phosphate transport system substrate-binding protein